MIARYAISILLGMFVTLTLIFVMHLLIEHAESAVTKDRVRHQLDFVRVRRNESINVPQGTPLIRCISDSMA